MALLTLTTDFGGHYAGIMKGVVKRLAPGAEVIDLTHEIDPWDLKSAAFVLLSSYKFFPEGTVHVVVVDPGVGTARRALIVETERYLFVGPDNGTMIPAAEEDGIRRAYEITNREFMLEEVSSTFHGRDIFAPAAAMIASGRRPEEAGREVRDWSRMEFRKRLGDGSAACEVVYADRFGNLTLSLRRDELDFGGAREAIVRIAGKEFVAKIARTFSDLEGRPGLVVGSAGFYELAIHKGSAKEALGASTGDDVEILWK